MTQYAINVTVPHNHGAAGGWERLLAGLQAQKDKPSQHLATVTILEPVNVFPESHRIVAPISVTVGVLWASRTETMTLTFQVNTSDVRITSDEADSRFEAAVMVAVARELEAMVKEAVK